MQILFQDASVKEQRECRKLKLSFCKFFFMLQSKNSPEKEGMLALFQRHTIPEGGNCMPSKIRIDSTHWLKNACSRRKIPG